MKNICLFFVSIVSIIMSGCTFTPKQISVNSVGASYIYGQEPKKRLYKDEGPYADENARRLQDLAFQNEQALVLEEQRHKQALQALTNRFEEIEAAKKLGFSVPTNAPTSVNTQSQYGSGKSTIPANQMTGALPIYSSAQLPPQAQMVMPITTGVPSASYGYSSGYRGYGGAYGTGQVSVKRRAGKLFGFLPYSGTTTSWSTHTVDPVYQPAQVDLYYTDGGGYNNSLMIGSDGRQVRTWGPGRK